MIGDISCIGVPGATPGGPPGAAASDAGLPPPGEALPPECFAALVDGALETPEPSAGTPVPHGTGIALRAAIAREWWAMLVGGAFVAADESRPATSPPGAGATASTEVDGELAVADDGTDDETQVVPVPPVIVAPLPAPPAPAPAVPSDTTGPASAIGDDTARQIDQADHAWAEPGQPLREVPASRTGSARAAHPLTPPGNPGPTDVDAPHEALDGPQATPATGEVGRREGPDRGAMAEAAAAATPKAAAVRLARAVDLLAAASAPPAFAQALARTSGDADGQAAGDGSRDVPGGDAGAALLRATTAVPHGVATFVVPASVATDPAVSAAAVPDAHVPTSDVPSPEAMPALVQAMRFQVRNGIGEAVVRLRPEHLGDVSIALQVDGTSVTATITADTPAVREWIATQEGLLRQGLADQGLELERLVVQPDDQAGQGDSGEQGQGRQRRQQARGQRPAAADDEPRFEIHV